MRSGEVIKRAKEERAHTLSPTPVDRICAPVSARNSSLIVSENTFILLIYLRGIILWIKMQIRLTNTSCYIDCTISLTIFLHFERYFSRIHPKIASIIDYLNEYLT